MKSDGIFSGLRFNLFPKGDLNEFWRLVSRALGIFIVATAVWLGYSSVRIVMSLSWEQTETVPYGRVDEFHRYVIGAYAFMVNEKKYYGSRYYFGGHSFSNKKRTDGMIFFNPSNPEQSVVYRHFSDSHLGFFLMMIGAIFARRFIYRNYAR